MIAIDISFIIIILLACIALFFVAGYAVKAINSKWKILWCIPVVVCMLISLAEDFEKCLVTVYIASVVLLIGFIKESEKLRKLLSVISAILTLSAIPVCLLSTGYRSTDYVAEFKKGFDGMKEHYVLSAHKNIDWDALYDEYIPKFKAVEDDIDNFLVWNEFTDEFKDGHVGFSPAGDYDEISEKAYDRVLGNDYGLSLMELSDGKVVAVNVSDSLAQAGIKNGTQVLLWDGKDAKSLGEGLTKYAGMCFADKDNEAFYKVLLGSGTGGDTVTITYLDEGGAEKTAELPKLGTYYSGRLKATLDIINQGIETGHLTWVDIDEKTSAFRIKMMMYDFKSMKNENHDALKYAITEKLAELKAKGVENIILDLRSNGGGSGDMVKAIASVFAPLGEHYYCTDGLWDDELGGYATDPETGKYVKGTDNYFTGENLWDGKVVVLVNALSVSAADHFVKVTSEFDNITVMGFTESNGSAQAVGGVNLDSGAYLQFSSCVVLDENGDIFIDSGEDMESGNDIEIKIDFTEETVKSLFDNDEDYVLNKALEYLYE